MSEAVRNWGLLVPVGSGDRVLDLSGDGGDTARRLAAAGASVTSLRRREVPTTDLPCAAVSFLTVRRLEEAKLDAAGFEAAIVAPSWPMGRPSSRSLRLLASWLRPGGLLFMGLENPQWARGPGRWARRRVFGGSANGRARGAWCRGVVRRLRRSGFDEVRVFCAFPDRARTKFLVPLGQPEVERYFLDKMLGGTSLQARLVRGLGRVAVRLRLLDQLVPSYEVLAVRQERS